MPNSPFLIKKSIRIYIISFLLLLIPSGYAGAGDDIQWKEIKSKYTVIRYQSDRDLEIFNDKVDYDPVSSESGLEWLLSSSGGNDPEKELVNKVDALYRRVQEILGMRKAMEKIKINIYHDKEQLKEAFFEIYRKEGNHRAWYVFELNTIFISIDDLHEGMLAHEMAHSIIDHYLTVRPPAASAEILARYVDSHLLE